MHTHLILEIRFILFPELKCGTLGNSQLY